MTLIEPQEYTLVSGEAMVIRNAEADADAQAALEAYQGVVAEGIFSLQLLSAITQGFPRTSAQPKNIRPTGYQEVFIIYRLIL